MIERPFYVDMTACSTDSPRAEVSVTVGNHVKVRWAAKGDGGSMVRLRCRYYTPWILREILRHGIVQALRNMEPISPAIRWLWLPFSRLAERLAR